MGLSTHILDTAIGRPAADVKIELTKQQDTAWMPISHGTTDTDGRCRTLLEKHSLEAAIYRLRFFTSSYYKSQSLTGLYPFVDIVFEVRDPEQHHHIPLLLTANGYTTYRGS